MRSRRKRIQYKLEFGLVRLLVLVCTVSPLRWTRRVGGMLGYVAYRVFRVRRRVVEANIERCIGGDRAVVSRIACGAYVNFGRCLMELASFHRISRDDLDEMVRVEGLAHFDKALAAGRGAILLSAHLGNWELLGAVIARHGYPVHVTDTNHSNKDVHRVITGLRRAQGMEIITPSQPTGYLLSLLSRNQFVAYLPDQDARAAGVFVDFFGRPAWTLRAPAVLAIRRRCPMVPGFLIREGVDRHRAVFLEAIWPDPQRRGTDAIVDLTERYTRVLEAQIRRHPHLYFWAHRRWKTQPAVHEPRSARLAG